ncbi:MAG: hypothetical protein QG635_207 [Bacteroidota bacterium]|nr:hypothetical protein [Bacteroidota bacterium]
MKKLAIIVLLLVIAVSGSYSQSGRQIIDAPAITWLGLDYSHVKFFGESIDNPVEVKQKYFKSWNDLILNEQKKYNLQECLRKSTIKYDLTVVTKGNDKANPAELTTMETYSISNETVESIIKGYELAGKTGMGLVFIMECMNKPDKSGSMLVVFFDMESKNIIFVRRMSGKPGGIGFRNYWASTYYNVLKDIGKNFDSMFK